jgi:hypothetical protein
MRSVEMAKELLPISVVISLHDAYDGREMFAKCRMTGVFGKAAMELMLVSAPLVPRGHALQFI